MVTTYVGKLYADDKRLAEIWDDSVAEVLWFVDGYDIEIVSQALSLEVVYASYSVAFRHEFRGEEPQPWSVFNLAVRLGFLIVVTTDPHPERN